MRFRVVEHEAGRAAGRMVGEDTSVKVLLVTIIEVERGVEHLLLRVEVVVVERMAVGPLFEFVPVETLLGAGIAGAVGQFVVFGIVAQHLYIPTGRAPTRVGELRLAAVHLGCEPVFAESPVDALADVAHEAAARGGVLDDEIDYGTHLAVAHAGIVDVLDAYNLLGREGLNLLVVGGAAVDAQAHLTLVGQGNALVRRVYDDAGNLQLLEQLQAVARLLYLLGVGK